MSQDISRDGVAPPKRKLYELNAVKCILSAFLAVRHIYTSIEAHIRLEDSGQDILVYSVPF